MDKKIKLEDLIKRSLALQSKDIQIPSDMLRRIKSRLATPEKITSKKRFQNRNVSSRVRLTLSVVLMISVLCCVLFKDTRSMAIAAVNMVKSIFVLESDGKGYRTVEKPVEKVDLTFSVSETTRLTDPQIAKKVGYKISFPKTLARGYALTDKTLGISLNKPLNYNLEKELNRRMNLAIEEEGEFKKLSDFSPQRDTCGIYKNSQVAIIFINIFRPWPKDALSGEIVTIGPGKIKAHWIECPFPIYPLKTENGIKGADMTKKPTDIKITHSLYWEYAGLGYYLNPFYTRDLALDEAVDIAESFMKGQHHYKVEMNH
jgi:hypothetical protein